MLKFRGITGPKSAQYTLKWAAAVSRGIPRICRGKPRNLANGAAEFGKICRGKLWALFMSPAKTAELRCCFGEWLLWAQGTTYYMGSRSLHGKGQFLEDVRTTEMHWESLLRYMQQKGSFNRQWWHNMQYGLLSKCFVLYSKQHHLKRCWVTYTTECWQQGIRHDMEKIN